MLKSTICQHARSDAVPIQWRRIRWAILPLKLFGDDAGSLPIESIMKKLTKKQREERDEAIHEVDEAWLLVQNGLDKLREANVTAVEAINADVTTLNEKIGDLNAFREDIAAEARGYIDERSDAWVEGDRGQAYEEFATEWEAEVDEVSEVDEPDVDNLELEVPEWPEEFEFEG